jgi:uncharacterized protein (TIGR00288 family)
MIPNAARRAPHQGAQSQPFHHAPNAALLIDFDNVTMGIRSDLGKELKALLNSEVIRGKVAVQRAYADWRRYPQYIVPLAESSIDLIFAPAYGSAKKNATDLRMAIDAIELVFTRPEIGTYILMTGDSDFSSCVLKLKEYGKYVIGVGMRESSSDLLIQNCDEYYSYHALSGLTRTDEVLESKEDPWVLLRRAAQQMVAAKDVMRTDRLKQVMLDLDPGFDEKKIGYSKFSRFVQEGASKGIIRLRKMENGQHEIEVDGTAAAAPSEEAQRAAARDSGNGRGRGRGRGRDRDREEGRREVSRAQPAPIQPSEPSAEPAAEPASEEVAAAEAKEVAPAAAPPVREAAAAPPVVQEAKAGSELQGAYGLLQQAVRDLGGSGGRAIRDGDVKRKMLEIAPSFDEGKLGFPKFTRFLRQAHDAEAIELQRVGAGNYEVTLGGSARRYTAAVPKGQESERVTSTAAAEAPTPPAAPAMPAGTAASGADTASAEAIVAAASPPAAAVPAPPAGRMGMRGRRTGRGAAPEGPPPLLPGQVVEIAKSVAPAPMPAPAEEAPVAVTEGTEEEQPTKSRSRRGRRGRSTRKDGAEQAAAVEQPATSEQPAAAEPPIAAEPAVVEPPAAEEKVSAPTRRRRGRGRGAAGAEEAPPILPGQAVSVPAAVKEVAKKTERRKAAAEQETEQPAAEAAPEAEAGTPVKKRKRTRSRARKTAVAAGAAAPTFSAEALGLPADSSAISEYLSTSYKGIGKKTAESLLDAFGGDLFRVMEEEPHRVRELLGDRRAGGLLEQWSTDVAGRRTAGETPATVGEAAPEAEAAPAVEAEKPKSRARRGTRGRGTRKKADAQ